MPTMDREGTATISVLEARANFGKLLERVDTQRQSLVIEKRGTPKAVLLSLRDYVRLATPEPEILHLLGELSKRNATDKLTSGQIERLVRDTRAERRKKR